MSYSIKSQNHFLQKTDGYETKYQTTIKAVGGKLYIEKIIEQKVENQIRQNQGKALKGQWSLELFEVPITLEQAWIVIPKDTKPSEVSIFFI